MWQVVLPEVEVKSKVKVKNFRLYSFKTREVTEMDSSDDDPTYVYFNCNVNTIKKPRLCFTFVEERNFSRKA